MRSLFPAILQLYTPETVFKVDFQQTFFLVSARYQSGQVVETFLLKIRLLVCGGASQKNRSLFTLAALYRKPYFFITCFFTKNRAFLLSRLFTENRFTLFGAAA